MNKSEIAEKAARVVAELKAARTAWHESYGVPVSAEYAGFLQAIGDLTDFVESVERAIAESRGQANDYFSLRKHLNDYESIFYGPHMCPCGDTYIVRRALAQGGQMYRVANYEIHECPKVELGDGEPSSPLYSTDTGHTFPPNPPKLKLTFGEPSSAPPGHKAICPECKSSGNTVNLEGTKLWACERCFIQWRESGAAQEVSPPSPEPTCQCDIPNSGLPIVGEGICCSCEKKI